MGKEGFLYGVYNAVLALGSLIVVPYYAAKIALTGKYRKSAAQKLGFVPPEITGSMKGRPRIWVHAVSVGEVTAAAPIVAALRASLPEACLVLSTSTETGQEMAGRLAPEATSGQTRRAVGYVIGYRARDYGTVTTRDGVLLIVPMGRPAGSALHQYALTATG